MTLAIDYYFTPLSGYAYLGHERLAAIAAAAGAAVNCRPMEIAKVFAASATTAPAKQSEARLAYRMADLARWAGRLGLTLNPKPKYWPVPDQLGGRAIIAAQLIGADPFLAAEALFKAVWAEERNISDPEEVSAALSAAGLPADEIIAQALDDQGQAAAQFTANTEDAIARGVFGSPSYCVGDELFWGQDRLDFVAEALALSPQQIAKIA